MLLWESHIIVLSFCLLLWKVDIILLTLMSSLRWGLSSLCQIHNLVSREMKFSLIFSSGKVLKKCLLHSSPSTCLHHQERIWFYSWKVHLHWVTFHPCVELLYSQWVLTWVVFFSWTYIAQVKWMPHLNFLQPKHKHIETRLLHERGCYSCCAHSWVCEACLFLLHMVGKVRVYSVDLALAAGGPPILG